MEQGHLFLISEKLLAELIQYLKAKPYEEVFQIIDALKKLPEVKSSEASSETFLG